MDGCRVGTTGGDYEHQGRVYGRREDETNWRFRKNLVPPNPSGRWPANTLLSHSDECVRVGTRRVRGHAGYPNGPKGNQFSVGDGPDGSRQEPWAGHADPDGLETIEAWECSPECPVRMLDEQSGERPGFSGGGATPGEVVNQVYGKGWVRNPAPAIYGDSGGASRFFYTAKSSRAERNAGLEGPPGAVHRYRAGIGEGHHPEAPSIERNIHPTVKPIALMRWLCRLVTPPGGTVLDPFAGSGTTGIAAELEGFDFIGIEREPEYVEIARARIAFWDEHGEDAYRRMQALERAETERAEVAAAGQGELF